MDTTYRVLWFEDTDEAFDTLSRRLKKYITGKNLIPVIDRAEDLTPYIISEHNEISNYDLLLIDLTLEQNSKGYDIINELRKYNYYNDVLFYSASGINELDKILKQHRLEGVFISDRDHKMLIPKAKSLIDKTIRRSENIVSIRGVVMDETSEFDNQIVDIILGSLDNLSQTEVQELKDYIVDLFKKRSESFDELQQKYNADTNSWEISDAISENDFSSFMKSRLLNKFFKLNNATVKSRLESCYDIIPGIFTDTHKTMFAQKYKEDVLDYRNILAHVKGFDLKDPVYIGEINGKTIYCDEKFCSSIRKTLIEYKNWFNKVYVALCEK